MKRVLGLDLGTTSIGWAVVDCAEHELEQSAIIKAGVRLVPLSSDEKENFNKGKEITTNAVRRQKRCARRNLQRYKLRREELIQLMTKAGWMSDDTLLNEAGNHSTFETYALRSQAVTEEISLESLARVLLMINKKRGYKSSRKLKTDEDGTLIDSMDVAKILYDNQWTPAEYCIHLINQGKSSFPDFYGSDLKNEFDRIWECQASHYPEILTQEFYHLLQGKSRSNTSKIFLARYSIYTAENKGKDKKVQSLRWRVDALSEKVSREVLAYILAEINGTISSSSGYLGSISDRSKELYFNNLTVGQYLYQELKKDPHFRVKNKVFFRQDYMDEFDAIWSKQATFHPELTDELKREIRDITIFYQRRLKSQKGLISFCEFENRCRVAPKSSLIFQEFKIWQILNNLQIRDKETSTSRALELDEKQLLAKELQIQKALSSANAIKLLGLNARKVELNFKTLEGNRTLSSLYHQLMNIVAETGHGEYDLEKLYYDQAHEIISDVLNSLGVRADLLQWDASLPKEQFEQQPLFKLWHMLYSYEGDNSKTGNESLIRNIQQLSGLPVEYAKILATTSFENDYASLSHKALKKILPFMKDGCEYSTACSLAGYRHSKNSLTKEELERKNLVTKLTILPKNQLRNPVVEKILNQMIHVVNAAAEIYGKSDRNNGPFDEIHIEMARELKQSAAQREEATKSIAENQKRNATIEEELKKQFGLQYVSKTDIVRYKLYQELEPRGYKTLYSNQYIPKEKLFSREIDIEHIIPQALLFDDSFANKTLEYRDINLDKGKKTAIDYVTEKYGQGYADEYKQWVEDLYKEGKIGRTKRDRLLMDQNHLPEDFINRDLTNTQYIAKKAKEILESLVREPIVTTNGKITDKLREDWGLVDLMKELNWEKYDTIGQTEIISRGDGHQVKRIKDWSKRNDHRHHAMDAITIAFTQRSHIQYLNNLSAHSNKESSIYGIEQKETEHISGQRHFKTPIARDQMRIAVRKALEEILISFKAKNKVVTRNINRSKKGNGQTQKQITLTPRGQLHKENVYGRLKQYKVNEVKIDGKLTADKIATVANKEEREALLKRLNDYGGDPKKAFAGKNAVDKYPIFLDQQHLRPIPNKVRCVELVESYTIRKAIDETLSINKVVDTRIRRILEERLEQYGGDAKSAFSNLDEHPIWQNEAQGIRITHVTIQENMDPVAIHQDRDYVSLKNNHHVAIYEDENGDLQENIVSFFSAVDLAGQGLPIVNRSYRCSEGWKFKFSMKVNEMFVFPNPRTGFDPNDIDLTDPENYSRISPNLYRVQKLSSKYYCFRHHLETELIDNKLLKDITWKRITAINQLKGIVKVRIDHLGRIVAVGEY